jgi:hypothetical protein
MTRLIWQVAILGFVFLLISIFSCWTIYDAYAESTDNVIVTWDYPNPPTDLAGFDLRINEDNATLINITEDAREWSGTLTFLDGNNTLDMRAKDLSGQVSIWSEPCYYNPIPNTPNKVTVTVKVIVIVN